MFKLDRKSIILTSVLAGVALLSTACIENKNTKPENASKQLTSKATIDGGVMYPIVNGKTGPYLVSTQKMTKTINNGRIPTANELKAWDTDVMPDGTGLPEGSGSVEKGEELYEAQCIMCHGDFGSGGGGYPALSKGEAQELQGTLKNQRTNPDADGPVRVFGSYWPQASTLYWYIRDGMPHPKTKTLSADEGYALTAYILNINEMSIDGEEVDDEYVLTREKFLKIKMPNVDGFEPKIDGPKALENVRTYYANPTNFGGIKVKPSERCMKDCQKASAKVVRIKGAGISDFTPPMSAVRDLPAKKQSGDDTKKIYEESCMMCHADSSMGAPALGDKKAWTTVNAKGMDKVYSNGINGINGMPPKGGADLSDAKFKSIVDYIINHSK